MVTCPEMDEAKSVKPCFKVPLFPDFTGPHAPHGSLPQPTAVIIFNVDDVERRGHAGRWWNGRPIAGEAALEDG